MTRRHPSIPGPLFALALWLAVVTLVGCTRELDLPPIPEPVDAGSDADPGQPDADDLPGPPRSCQIDADCDDALACTTDRCLDAGHCAWEIAPDRCLIDGVCRDAFSPSPRSRCELCDPGVSPFEWTIRLENDPCDDGDACTFGERCLAGVCRGGDVVSCEGDNPCAAPRCDPARGCVFDPVNEGVACDDGDACTQRDACRVGACAGDPLDCDDGNPCTDDTCSGGACDNTPNDNPCSDGDECTTGDTCDKGACVADQAANCDDGNICTIDGCDALAGCFNLPTENPCCVGLNSICDDGDPCTSDLCDPEGGDCVYQLNAARCDDQSACTTGDTCQQGRCQGAPVICDDDNVCTDDRCNDTLGCVASPLSEGACDDGVQCTLGDACVQGVCRGDASGCVCEPDFGQTAVKFIQARIADAGAGLDLTGDGRPDNQLGVLGALVNGPIQDGVDQGSLILLMDFLDFQQNPFELAAYDGALSPDDLACDLQGEVCDYLVGASLLDPDTCAPRVVLSATLSGQTLSAGGPGTTFPFLSPCGDGILRLTLYEVRLEATVVIQNGQVTSIDGTLAGAVRRAELLAALRQLPEGALPFPVDAIAPILDRLAQDDVDTTDDGVDRPDAASIALSLAGIGARLVGVQR